MTRLFWLSDEAWAAIDPHLPRGKPGKPRVDDRRVISGILHVLKTGCRWRDVPAEYGPATTRAPARRPTGSAGLQTFKAEVAEAVVHARILD